VMMLKELKKVLSQELKWALKGRPIKGVELWSKWKKRW
jgi:hypothetical protein